MEFEDTVETLPEYSKDVLVRGIKGQRDKLNRFIELVEKAELSYDQLLFLEDDFASLELVTSTLYQTLNNDVEERDSLDNYLEP